MNFDMNSCWSRGVELVTSNFQLLSAIAAIFFLLPNVAIYLLMPDMQTLSDPMADQQVVQARIAEILLPFMGVMIVSLIVQFVGYGTMVGLMSEERPTVGQALSTALKAMPSLLAIFVIFALAYIFGAFLIILPFSILGGVAGSPFLAILGILPILVFVTWLMARFSMSLPVMILENRLNPLTAISTSFRLTKPKQWQILLFWFVIFVVMTIISVIIQSVSGLFAALIGTGTMALILLGLVSGTFAMITGMLVSALAVAMYGQLDGPDPAGIEETFE